jgi:AcrR family transcriptional regulator
VLFESICGTKPLGGDVGVAVQRRTQAERTAAACKTLIESTIACLNAKGFGATTSQDIVKRAQCTTGAIQHHFGSKNGLYIAVLDQLLDEFKAGFETFPHRDEALEQRCTKTIAALDALYTSTRYGAGQSLVLGAQHDPELRDLVARQRRGALALAQQAWLNVFRDLECSDAKLLSFLEIIVGVLRDFHFNKTVGVKEARMKLDTNLTLLGKMVLSELQKAC